MADSAHIYTSPAAASGVYRSCVIGSSLEACANGVRAVSGQAAQQSALCTFDEPSPGAGGWMSIGVIVVFGGDYQPDLRCIEGGLREHANA